MIIKKCIIGDVVIPVVLDIQTFFVKDGELQVPAMMMVHVLKF
jgi:hypothetical protein